MCQNTPQLCWGDEWPPLSPGRQPGRASGPEATLILPHQGGGKFFRELDAPQLPPGQRPSGPAAATGLDFRIIPGSAP